MIYIHSLLLLTLANNCCNSAVSQHHVSYGFPDGIRKFKGLRPLPPTPADSRIFGFLDFSKNAFLGIFQWDLGSEKVCNGLGMAVGFKWTDSQLILSHLGAFPSISMISMILASFPVV